MHLVRNLHIALPRLPRKVERKERKGNKREGKGREGKKEERKKERHRQNVVFANEVEFYWGRKTEQN